MERKFFIFAVKVGTIYGGLLLLYLIFQYVLLSKPIIPVLTVFLGLTLLIPFLLAGITVVMFTRKVNIKPIDTLTVGAISGGVIGFFGFMALILRSVLLDLQVSGEYTSSNSGLFLVAYCCGLGSIPAIALGLIAGAVATACALIALKLYRSFR
jgi:hypothetical protein